MSSPWRQQDPNWKAKQARRRRNRARGNSVRAAGKSNKQKRESMKSRDRRQPNQLTGKGCRDQRGRPRNKTKVRVGFWLASFSRAQEKTLAPKTEWQPEKSEDAGAEQNEAARRERETPRTKTDPPKTKKTPEPKRIQTARPTAGDEDCGEPKISEEVASIKPKPKDQTLIQIEIKKG
jgi:hypothetical protein